MIRIADMPLINNYSKWSSSNKNQMLRESFSITMKNLIFYEPALRHKRWYHHTPHHMFKCVYLCPCDLKKISAPGCFCFYTSIVFVENKRKVYTLIYTTISTLQIKPLLGMKY